MEANSLTRRRWFHFRLRTLLVLVSVLCIGIASMKWLRQREEAFLNLHQEHLHQTQMEAWFLLEKTPTNYNRQRLPRKMEQPFIDYADAYEKYHEQLSRKYSYAWAHPWLPVEPDPPEPKMPQRSLPRGFMFSFAYPRCHSLTPDFVEPQARFLWQDSNCDG